MIPGGASAIRANPWRAMAAWHSYAEDVNPGEPDDAEV
jgi:hypothetical protein